MVLMNDWIRIKLSWLHHNGNFNKITGTIWPMNGSTRSINELIPLKVGELGEVYLREDISFWIKENDIAFKSAYTANYLKSIQFDLQFLVIKFTDPRDKLMFIMRFEE